MLRAIFLVLATAASAAAQTLTIDTNTNVSRKDTLRATLKLTAPRSGEGELKLRWTDSYGRVVAEESSRVKVEGDAVPISLPLRRAVAMQNFLEAELAIQGETLKSKREEFIVTPPAGWDDYQVIMYYPYKPTQQPGLRDLGVTAGQIQNVRSHNPRGASIWWEYDFPFYCDQMAYDFYAPYHTPALKDKEQRMREAKALYKSDRSRKDAFFRQPCLNDPQAEGAALEKVRSVVRAQNRFRPFFYSTDETGVANLVEAWDFCFCPLTMKAMRPWLLEQYGSLEAINREWGTSFRTIDDVMPLSTDEMMKRGDDNFSPWADHRTFMNLTFANAAKKASEAARSVDLVAIAGLVGCQMPSAFGGYDYWLLSRAVDVAEPYNIGNNREIWRSFAPHKPALTTGFGADAQEVWRLWYQALHGDLGVIIYDEKNRYLDPEGKPTALGERVAPTYRELTGGIVKQLHSMERVNDPVAIHYSHPSITAHWMIERRPLGESWVEKRSASERIDSDFLRLRQSAIYLLEDNLRQYAFVSYGTKVLILPQSIAMSKAETEAVRRFVARGGTVIADCRTALMDNHGKAQPRGQLDDLFGIERADMRFAPGPAGLQWAAGTPKVLGKVAAAEPGIRVLQGATALYHDSNGTPAVIVKKHQSGRTIYLNAVITDYHRWRMRPPEGESLRLFVEELLSQAGVSKQYEITRSDGSPAAGIEVHPFRSGNLRILGVHRNYGLRVTELGPPEYQKQDALDVPMELTVKFDGEVSLYDPRHQESLGRRREFTFKLDKTEPTLLAITPAAASAPAVQAPSEARRGALVEIPIEIKGESAGTSHAIRVRLLDPASEELRMLTRTLAAPGGKTTWELPLAMNLTEGRYTAEVVDIPTGSKSSQVLTVR
jgi:Beta-galactosidase trimerisation domain